jgi:NADH-quinone oxidoreductase subunit N
MNGIDIVGPQLAVLIAAALVLVVDAVLPQQRRFMPYIALAGLASSALWTTSWIGRDELPKEYFDGTLSFDHFSAFFYYLFAGVTATVVLASIDWVSKTGRGQGEYYALVLTACSGLMFLAAARDLITIFIALELSSIPQYILAGWAKDSKSGEAGLKYLLLGAIASALLLYGMALLYGLTGETLLPLIASRINDGGEASRAALVLAMVLIIAGFGFKMAIVPFQMWVPDVYQGAPTPVAAFLSVGSKAAAFAVVTRIFFEALPADFLRDDWSMMFAIIAAATMVLGNLMAVAQKDIKRLLGYSSIAQAGTFMVGLAAISASGEEFKLGASSVLFFLAAYAFTNLGAFVAVIAISQRIGSDLIEDYRGMWKRAPGPAAALAFCLVSLAGIPPTVGFFGKMLVFWAGIRADFWWLVLIGVLSSLVSGFYYFRIALRMFASDSESTEKVKMAPGIGISLAVSTLGVLVFGIIPMPLLSAARDAADIFVQR